MSLPNLPAGDKFRREVRTEWGGLNLNESASDGELVEAVNMSSREFPVLSTERLNYDRTENGTKIAPYLIDGKLGYIKKNGTNSYQLYDPTTGGGLETISLTDAQADKVQYGQMGNRMVIWPSKQIYDFSTHTVSALEATWSYPAGQCVIESEDDHTDGYDVIKVNSSATVTDDIKVGDAVTISGCTRHPENNISAIVRKVERYSDDMATLYFDSGIFETEYYYYTSDSTLLHADYFFHTDAGYVLFTLTSNVSNPRLRYFPGRPNEIVLMGSGGDTIIPATVSTESSTGTHLSFDYGYDWEYKSYSEATAVTVKRAVPDMDYICVNENRLWGCKGDTIYASKLGDPTNWNVFDGLSTDSWTTETGTDGIFTGCCSFQSYPTFFKEGSAFKVLGDEPKDFTLRKLNVVGVKNKCSKTIVEITGYLYYVSAIGVVKWNGGDYPSVVSHAIGPLPGLFSDENNRTAVAGTDGVRYIIEAVWANWAWEEGEPKSIRRFRTFVYDPRVNTWHELVGLNNRELGVLAFATDGSHAYMLAYTTAGETEVYVLSELGRARVLPWRVTFADSTRAYKTALTGSESKKGVLRLLIRCRISDAMKVWIAYDGGDFEEAAEFTAMDKNSKVVPLILRRCDFWQLRLTGTGDAVIYSIAVEKYGGEWQQA